jgi:hypothetical protein
MTRPVGRPKSMDESGMPIDKVTVNVTIPVRLKEYLDKNCKNRSELFTKVVSQLFSGEICSRCYSMDVIQNTVGGMCRTCSRYGEAIYYNYNNCENCKLPFKAKVNMPRPVEDIIACDNCYKELIK